MENKRVEFQWNSPCHEAEDMTAGKNNCQCLEDLPLAMAYVPMQKWRKIYEPDVAFARGTIFAELDLPFIGEGCD